MQKRISLPSEPFSNDLQIRNLSGLGKEGGALAKTSQQGTLQKPQQQDCKNCRAEPKLVIFSEFEGVISPFSLFTETQAGTVFLNAKFSAELTLEAWIILSPVIALPYMCLINLCCLQILLISAFSHMGHLGLKD